MKVEVFYNTRTPRSSETFEDVLTTNFKDGVYIIFQRGTITRAPVSALASVKEYDS